MAHGIRRTGCINYLIDIFRFSSGPFQGYFGGPGTERRVGFGLVLNIGNSPLNDTGSFYNPLVVGFQAEPGQFLSDIVICHPSFGKSRSCTGDSRCRFHRLFFHPSVLFSRAKFETIA
jgi:hypothetical protein